MNDMAQVGLKEPERVDWEHYSSVSTYQPPPPALGPDGKPITYYGVAEDVKVDERDDKGYLQVLIDPIKIVRSGPADGRIIRFTRASTRPFTRKNRDTGEEEPVKGNPNKLANFLRACGLSAKPQTNSEYLASVQATKGKTFPFTLDWSAYNKETGERVDGYLSFPEDPERPGQRKTILKAGDLVIERDAKGNVTGTRTVQSEVLFANARLRYFQDATPKVGGR